MLVIVAAAVCSAPSLAGVGVDPPAASGAQTSPLPSGPLVFRVFTAHFQTDGTFVVEGAVEGLGTLNVTGKWRAERDSVQLVGYDVPASAQPGTRWRRNVFTFGSFHGTITSPGAAH